MIYLHAIHGAVSCFVSGLLLLLFTLHSLVAFLFYNQRLRAMRTGFMHRCCQTALAGLLLCIAVVAIPAAEKGPPAEPPPKGDDPNEAQQQTLRSYLQLQEQLHNTLLTIERTRREADAAAKANADAIAVRLETIEQSLSTQQNHEANLLQDSNRVTLISAGIFGGLGLLAMIFTAWFLVRAMNRLATVAA